MSSLPDVDSSIVQSTAIETIETAQTSETKWRAPVWKFCRKPQANENQSFLYCTYCTKPEHQPPYGTAISSNMTKHFRKHEIVVEKPLSKVQAAVVQQLAQLYLQAEVSGETGELNSQVLKSQLNQSVINEALITLIVVRNLPFSLVEWPEFHTLCQALNSECKDNITTAHSTIRLKIKDSWTRHKDVVRRELQSAVSRIHIALDIWTSPNRYLLIAICAHFTTHLFKRQKALLALQKVAGHSGENQFAILLPVLEDYGIVRKLGAIIADNASTNDTLCGFIESHWYTKLDLEWKALHWRIRCIGHIINLAVQAFLFANVMKIEELELYDAEDQNEQPTDQEARRIRFRLLGPLGQIHNILVYVRGSAARIEEFVALVGRMIPLDNRTRWNSWYNMLVIVLEKRSEIEKYIRNHELDLEEDELTPADWKKLRTIKDFLSVCARATLFTEGDSTSIDKVLFTMDILIKHFQITLVSRLF